MDVRCSRCGVEYEFDEEKVRPAGVTVKCTSCGHVFKVKPPLSQEESAPLLAAPNADGWMVRHRDGTVMRFKELTTLQKWIVEQKVTSRDEISRTGRNWRPLGDIAELASFFEVVDAANAAKRAAEAGRAAIPAEPAGDAPVALSRTKTRDSDVHTPPPTALKRQAPAVTPVPPEAEAGFYGGSLDDLDDEDPVVAWRRRARRRNAALVVVALIVAGVAGLFFLARPTFDRLVAEARSLAGGEGGAAPVPPPDELARRVDAQLRAALPLDALVQELSAKVAAPDALPAHVAALSRLHAHEALKATFTARLLEERERRGATDTAEALAGARKRADEELAAAYTLASRARTAAPDSPEADLAFATYQAAKGALPELSADLDAARRHASAGDARVAHEGTVLSALAAVVAASDEGAREQARLALPGSRRNAEGDLRLALASFVLDALRGRTDDAAVPAALERWRQEHPGERWASLALELLTTPAAEGAEPAPKPDETTAPEATADDAKAGEPAATASDEDDADRDESAPSLDYDAVMRRANKNRIRERTSAAIALYKQAVDLRPQAAKPHVGLGWCYLDLERNRQAADAFAYAITLDKDLAEAHFGLAEAQRYSGNKAAAVRSYKRYLELAPSGPDAPVARNAIKSLEEE